MIKKEHQYYIQTDYVSEAAVFIYGIISHILSTKNIANIAVSGGSTPLPIYQKLFSTDLSWENINIFLVDERCEPWDSPESNFGNIKKLSGTNIKLFSMFQPGLTFEELAVEYSKIISETLNFKNNIPEFDLILLGMGEDGHTASLFPNSEGLREKEKFVIFNKVENLYPNRLTLTYPVILNAQNIICLIKGQKKKAIAEEIKAGNTNYPIAKIAKEAHFFQWILD